jgi:hypothetical protein
MAEILSFPGSVEIETTEDRPVDNESLITALDDIITRWCEVGIELQRRDLLKHDFDLALEVYELLRTGNEV